MLCAVCPCRSYIEKHFGGAENFSTQDLQQAMTHMRENLDGSDKGHTISESEVEDHLRSLMQVRAPVSCRQLETQSYASSPDQQHGSHHRKGGLPLQAWLHHSGARATRLPLWQAAHCWGAEALFSSGMLRSLPRCCMQGAELPPSRGAACQACLISWNIHSPHMCMHSSWLAFFQEQILAAAHAHN